MILLTAEPTTNATGIVISDDIPAAVIIDETGIIIPAVPAEVRPTFPPDFRISIRYSSSERLPFFHALYDARASVVIPIAQPISPALAMSPAVLLRVYDVRTSPRFMLSKRSSLLLLIVPESWNASVS